MREFKIACAYSRKALKWQNQKITWPELCDRLKNTTYTPETREEYQQMSKDDRDAVKDRGGFVGGFLKDGRRKVVNVECRSLITHDVDSAEKVTLAGGMLSPKCRITRCTEPGSSSSEYSQKNAT